MEDMKLWSVAVTVLLLLIIAMIYSIVSCIKKNKSDIADIRKLGIKEVEHK